MPAVAPYDPGRPGTGGGRLSARLAPVGFDYADDRRGYWARLRDGSGREILITEYPVTLLAMLKAGVLVGEAKMDAEKLKELGESAASAGS